MADEAVLKAIPNDSKKYSVLRVSNALNIAVIGGTLEGERDQHSGKTGEWGMGVWIGEGAEHVTISGVTATKMWGDGFYIQGANDVKPCSVTADNNRRQGLSIIQVNGLELYLQEHAWNPSKRRHRY
jgi:hypothetical protein